MNVYVWENERERKKEKEPIFTRKTVWFLSSYSVVFHLAHSYWTYAIRKEIENKHVFCCFFLLLFFVFVHKSLVATMKWNFGNELFEALSEWYGKNHFEKCLCFHINFQSFAAIFDSFGVKLIFILFFSKSRIFEKVKKLWFRLKLDYVIILSLYEIVFIQFNQTERLPLKTINLSQFFPLYTSCQGNLFYSLSWTVHFHSERWKIVFHFQRIAV